MVTGYTDGIETGLTFEQFALRCARSFGPCTRQVDDPLDVPPKTIPVTVDTTQYDQAVARLQTLEQLTGTNDRTAFVQSDLNAAKDKAQQQFNDSIVHNEKLDELEAAVNVWLPPTYNHLELKEFMSRQIEYARMDNHRKSQQALEQLGRLSKISPIDFYHELVVEAKDAVVRAEQDLAQCRHDKQANEWIEALYKSLEPVNA